MKRYLVGMLAVISLAGCGLDLDESFDANGELIVGTPEGAVLGQGTSTALSPGAAGLAVGDDGGTPFGEMGFYAQGAVPYGATSGSYEPRGLPQDPVPVKPQHLPSPGLPGSPTW